jgi:DNA ligase 1
MGPKVQALADYFREVEPADAAWTLFFLSGRKLKRLANTTLLRRWAAEVAGVEDWLFEECYDAVGDLAETIALIVPHGEDALGDESLDHWIRDGYMRVLPLTEEEKAETLKALWQKLPARACFLYMKLVTGGFRIGVSQQLVIKALAEVSGIEATMLAHRLTGNWEPTAEFYTQLLQADASTQDLSKPYPFFLAYALEDELETLGAVADWQAEWKWDGIRAQLIHRAGEVYLWSRGEELLTEGFPEMAALARSLPEGTALDGELLVWLPDKAQPEAFAELQKRITRKKVSPKMLRELPAVLLAYDVLEHGGQDIRAQPLAERRKHLEGIVTELAHPALRLSPTVVFADWAELATQREAARSLNAEGLMLKRLDSTYGTGRRRGPWWKWKVNPMTADAVLVYAQQGHGRRAGLYTDYTFAIWHGGALVPFAKAYSGLTDDEIRQVDAFIKAHTLERFGPVRTVAPELVFELAFEGIQPSTRHKSGLAVRFPRILRWRTDKPAAEADTYETLLALLGG